MKTEFELRILEIDVQKIVNKLMKLGAKKIGKFEQKRYIYDLKPATKGKWIRLRTNGSKTTLTYKDIISNTIDGTKEVEIKVESFEQTNEFLENIGFYHRNYQENIRIQYILDGVEVDIDFWPMIPTYLEIEGESEDEIRIIKEKLEIDDSKVTFLNCDDIYSQIYGIELSEIKELKF